jgi:hypothetical protein
MEEEDSQQVTLIKELKSKLSIKLDHGQNEAETKENNKNTDDIKLFDKTADDKQVHPKLVSEILSDFDKICLSLSFDFASNFTTSASTDCMTDFSIISVHSLFSSSSLSGKEEISNLQKDISSLKATINNHDKLQEAIKERQDIMDTVKLQEATKERQDIMDTVKERQDIMDTVKQFGTFI